MLPGAHTIGIVGAARYWCWDCWHEFAIEITGREECGGLDEGREEAWPGKKNCTFRAVVVIFLYSARLMVTRLVQPMTMFAADRLAPRNEFVAARCAKKE